MSLSGVLKRCAGALSVLALAVSAVVAAPPAVAAEPKNLQVMSWNMCDVPRWNCTGTGTSAQKAGVVKYHVDNSYVQAALLQEVCENTLATLMTQLGPGWSRTFHPYQWSQNGARHDSPCVEGAPERVGTAIVVKAGMGNARKIPTTQPWTGLQAPFQCANATYWDVELCNVHASWLGINPDHPDWDYRDDQFAEIKTVVDAFPRTVFGGDFNAQAPDVPNNTSPWVWPQGLYSQGPGTPGYQECDQTGTSRTGRPTHASGVKIDYLFSTETRRWCVVADSAYSDHHVMIESVAVG
ncbi:endonuclease/exonuclease/phosphatase family protein [Streptomyces anulatus]|uniref:endonuclease/exonuclease/phosphatase family protein n=1 Tax=Streptomyces anulatus TaxID=1892 RepID=UPI002E2FA438|nr:endonuclease/exonuclease/phosphatase family protein [Streptomyces anulatus]